MAYCENVVAQNVGGRRAHGSTPVRLGGDEINANFFGQSSFTTHSIADEDALVKVPDVVPLELVAPLGYASRRVRGHDVPVEAINQAVGDSERGVTHQNWC